MPEPDSDAPKAPTFDVLSLSPDVRKAVDELGYVHPTPVQRAVFEPATRGKDLVVQARTGTGKTAAFGLPVIDALVRRGVQKPQAIVLCPTRELALQVTREVEALGKHRGTRVAAVYGGAPMARQIQAIRDGAQIIVGTPGRVLDHLRRGTLDATSLRVMVLDESDEMLSMGFLPQITEVMGFLPETRQTLLFSATLPPDIQRIAETKLKEPQFITLSGDSIGALEIDHFVYLSRSDKVQDLLSVLEVEDPESAIVFCNTRDETKRVASALNQQGFEADWLNADLGQSDREKVMDATRKGKLRFLVATDVAARGIDISHLTHVINHDFPESAEQYVHRTGRTGRAGRTGTAISLIEPGDIGNLYYLRLTYKIRPIEKQLPSARDRKTRAEADIVEMFAKLFADRKTDADDLALARRVLTHEDCEKIIAGLLRDHLGAKPGASEQAAAARRAREPRPAPAEPSPERREEPRRREKIPERERAETRRSSGNGTESERRGREERTPRDDTKAGGRRRGRAKPSGAEAAAAPSGGSEQATRMVVFEPDEPDTDANVGHSARDVAEVYINVGRKDGAKASDFYQILSERAGVGIDDTDYVNVRHRHSFIGVRKDYLERVVAALNGAVIAGRAATAEPSRPRSSSASGA